MRRTETDHVCAQRLVRRYPWLFIMSYPSVGQGWIGVLRLVCKHLERDGGGYWRNMVKWAAWWCFQRWNWLVYHFCPPRPWHEPATSPSRYQRVMWGLVVHYSDFPHFSDIKEKYGRCDMNGYGMDHRLFRHLEAGERLSMRTCEQCGKRGWHIPLGWHHTVCKDHASEEDLVHIDSQKTGLQRAIDGLDDQY